MSKRTWQPKRKKRLRKHGFLARMSEKKGRKIINKRRSQRQRKNLTVHDEMRSLLKLPRAARR